MSSEIIFGNEIELVPILKVFSDIKPNSLKMIQIRNLLGSLYVSDSKIVTVQTIFNS